MPEWGTPGSVGAAGGQLPAATVDKSRDDVRQVKATIEAVLELREISLSILGTNRMVGAAQGVLDIAENRIHPSELGALNSGSPAAHHHRLMNAARGGDAMKASQAIGDDPSADVQVLLRPGGDFGETEALDDGELHAQRVSLRVGLDGGDKGRLGGRATTALAAASFATEIGVIELDPPAERVLAVSLHHHLHQLVSDAPRGVVGDTQMAVQLHRRDPFLVLGHEVDGLEPHSERQFGGVEDGARGNRGLAMTAIALLELAAAQLAAAVMATALSANMTETSASFGITVGRLIHPLILLSNDTKDFLEYPLLHKHLQKPLHQWTDSLIRPVGNMVIQHQPLTKQRVRSIFHRVRL